MDETARPDTGDDSARSGGDGTSAGALLRAAREGQGMHIATLAAAIKVSPRKLEALENDRWDELPGPTFTRALAQAVCRALKTDPRPVMELLPAADTSMLDSTFGTINEPFAGRAGREAGWASWLPRGPWLIAAIVLLVAAALVLWAPAGLWGRLFGAAAPAGGTSVTAAVPSGGHEAPGGAAVSPGAAAAGPLPAAAPAAGPAAAGTASTAAPPGVAVPAQADAGGRADAPPAPSGDLVFQCSSRSWIEVVDAQGRVLVSRNLEAGEALGLDGLAPLQVVVGNAAGTLVSYKGKPVELASRTRDNVARFELK
jgi:cytoskeleton protein RodZ